jgi:hypothetical protein
MGALIANAGFRLETVCASESTQEGRGTAQNDDGKVFMAEQKSSYGYEELLACARGELFGPGNAQLPAPPMLMFDRITEISETGGAFDKGFIRAEFDM